MLFAVAGLLVVGGCGEDDRGGDAVAPSELPSTTTSEATPEPVQPEPRPEEEPSFEPSGESRDVGRGTAREVCGSLPPSQIARELGVPGASSVAIAEAYGEGYRDGPAEGTPNARDSAEAGCLEGLSE